MKLTKEALKRIIKEELESSLEEEAINEDMAYHNPSMKDRVELQYGGNRIDYLYKFAGQSAEAVVRAIHHLTDKKGKIGDVPKLAKFMHSTLVKNSSKQQEVPLPTLEQIENMRVYFN